MFRHRHCITYRQTWSPHKILFFRCVRKTIAKTTINHVIPVCCLSVRRAHGTTRLPLNIFLGNFILEFLLKFVGTYRFWLKSDTVTDLRTFVISRHNWDHSIEITNRCNCMQWILFLCLIHSTCFGRHTRPSSGVQLYLQPLVQS